MNRLVLVFKKQVIKEFPLTKPSMTIGRKSDNDIVIDNLAVSGHHARIDKTGSDYILTDLQSTNGTFVNNKRVVSHRLMHKDQVLIGKHTIFYLASQDASVDDKPVVTRADLDKTVMLDRSKQGGVKDNAAQPPSAKEKIGVLTSIDNSDLGEIDLTKKLTRLGKSDNSEVRLSGMLIPPTAATISKRPNGYAITFTGGNAKLKVNGEVIHESIALKDFDTIEIGSHKFQFYQKDLN